MQQPVQMQQPVSSEHQSLFSSSLLTPFPGMQVSNSATSYPARPGPNQPGLLSTSLASSNGQTQQQQPDQAMYRGPELSAPQPEPSLPAGSQQLTPSLDPQLPVPPKRLPPVQAQRAPSVPSQVCASAHRSVVTVCFLIFLL